MKYYIKVKNIKTGQGAIMNVPVFTNRKKAQEWADAFVKGFGTPVAQATVVREGEN